MINTARVEESGRSILECLALGKVIFTTPTTGAKEILNNNKDLISKDFNPESLVKLIKDSKREYKINLDKYIYSKNKERFRKLLNRIYNYKGSNILK